MAGDETSDSGAPELTAEECIRAGMYWFGQGDLAAAEAWWNRALYLEPQNVRAQECLRLLARTVEAVQATGVPAMPPEPSADIPRANVDPFAPTPSPMVPDNPLYHADLAVPPAGARVPTGDLPGRGVRPTGDLPGRGARPTGDLPGDPFASRGTPMPGVRPPTGDLPGDPFASRGTPMPGVPGRQGDPFASRGTPMPGVRPPTSDLPGDPFASRGTPMPGVRPPTSDLPGRQADPFASRGTPVPPGVRPPTGDLPGDPFASRGTPMPGVRPPTSDLPGRQADPFASRGTPVPPGVRPPTGDLPSDPFASRGTPMPGVRPPTSDLPGRQADPFASRGTPVPPGVRPPAQGPPPGSPDWRPPDPFASHGARPAGDLNRGPYPGDPFAPTGGRPPTGDVPGARTGGSLKAFDIPDVPVLDPFAPPAPSMTVAAAPPAPSRTVAISTSSPEPSQPPLAAPPAPSKSGLSAPALPPAASESSPAPPTHTVPMQFVSPYAATMTDTQLDKLLNASHLPRGGGTPAPPTPESARIEVVPERAQRVSAYEATHREQVLDRDEQIPDQVWDEILAEDESGPVPMNPPPPNPTAAALRQTIPPVPPQAAGALASEEQQRRARALEERLFGNEERSWEPPVDLDAAAWALGQQAESAADPLDFASDAVVTEDLPEEIQYASPPQAVLTPWDDGPSRTSVVTLAEETDHDAVAEPTPLPELEREQFFRRQDPPPPPPARVPFVPSAPPPPPPADIVFDDPVELETAAPPQPPQQTPEGLLREAKNRFHLHDFAGAIELLARINPGEPGHDEARTLLTESRGYLTRMYESKIGDFERIPHVLISSEEIIWLNLNHRAGFILSQIDGAVTYEDIIALSGMPRLDTLAILTELIQNRVIGAD